MNLIRKNLGSLLTAWGRQQQAPYHNETLKSQILAKLESQSSVPSFSPRHGLPWATFVFSGLAVTILIVSHFPQRQFINYAPQSLTEVGSSGKVAESFNREIYPRPYLKQGAEISITDQREFLKTDYSATIRTRQVESMTRQVQNAVRLFDGRTDGLNSSAQWGVVDFVLPAGQLEGFQKEMRDLVWTRFLTEETSIQNLLPQKQFIEQQQQQISGVLEQLKKDKNRLTASHYQVLAAIKWQVEGIVEKLAVLKIREDVTSDPLLRVQLEAQEEALLNEKKDLEVKLAEENTVYGRKRQALVAQIEDSETNLDRVVRQDQDLVDTVETVRGTVSLRWISLGEIIGLYMSLNWLALLLAGGAVISFVVRRRRSYLYLPH